MIQIQMTFPSLEAATEFLTQRTNSTQPEAARPAPVEQTPPAAAVEPEKKRGRPAKTPVQATVTGNGAGAAPAATTAVGNNGASVQPATPPEAGATGGESEKQLPLAGVDPAPPAPTAATATETEMKDAAKAVIAKLGQIEGMNKAREVLERVAGVKLIRDVPADKYGAVKAAMDGLLA